ncbi:Uncharacterized protein SCF082_LOCUS41530 [Durusdinium trenchii]|uniref:Uncharacterized protein n=1 Tax=Durusdinium trenchii TaxID=1381693 RepID=A0ABP0QJX1_9DINO
MEIACCFREAILARETQLDEHFNSIHALSTLLLKYNAACLAGDLYFTLPFVPTRFNTSDDPTRGRNVRTPSSKIPLSEATDAQVRALLNLPPLRRWRLLQSFLEWCEFAGFAMKPILDEPALFVEKINEILLAYGRRLYEAGKTYSHYVETINSVASFKPIWRRQLQASWDMAFSWVREERPVHHIAMPFQILLAMLSIALSWGWLNVAGLLALGWGALLRTSEMTHALRSDLLLPSDTFFSNRYALLALREPKTRFVSARHQSAKLDIPDLLSLVETAFQQLEGHQRLWPFSDQTLRHRFSDILKVLHLDAASIRCPKTLDLGSLRPGGATWMMHTCEDSELVRRRGRWLNQRVMEIYIQEISSMQLLIHLSKSQRDLVFNIAATFPSVLEKITVFQRAHIPTKAWFALLRSSEP